MLLNLIGHEENVGHHLIRMEASAELESSLRRDIIATSPRALAAECELLRLLYWVKAATPGSEPAFKVPRDKVLDCALLKAAVGHSRSQGLGTRTVRIEKELRWDILVDLTGGEDAIKDMLALCRLEEDDLQLAEAVELADKYLTGRRSENL